MRKIDKIILHCADTYARMDIGVKEIREWHQARGFADIGYHFVIRRNGEIETGRPLEKFGAHAQGYNATSIGICYAGGKADDGSPEDNRTPAQKASLLALVTRLLLQFPNAQVLGHRDLPGVQKACPCFSVSLEFKKH
ncbi:MAG: N-acetylmuramoyl-L-alanine amidase [Odoribacter sp.]